MSAARVLLVVPEEWPRALLRAELRERGYDAIGAPSLTAALVYPAQESGRGEVRLLILAQEALGAEVNGTLQELRRQHREAAILLLAAGGEPPHGPWAAVIRPPFRTSDVVRAVERLLPLEPHSGRRLDS